MDKLINVNSYPINKVLKYLLMDKTTGKNIIWATDTYTTSGKYKDTDTIETVDLVGFDSLVLQPRISKSLEEQQQRTRKKAEVFTPVWLCNHMNNYCDEQWFGRKDVFNVEREDHSWKVVKDKIEFPKGKGWKKYVDSRRLEITCGEAPFLVSRYDMATGDLILLPKMRIGILDRKMRIVNENASADDWLKWTIRAFQACYGYEYQGDNLLIARINMLLSFRDYYLDHFEEEPDLKVIKKIATIISWNLWQMDGLHGVVPKGSMNEINHQFSLFEMYENDNEIGHKEDISSRVFNWRSNKSLLYTDCKGDIKMSKKLFDYCIGNPPYQEDTAGAGRQAKPIYNLFMSEAKKLASKGVSLITPSRWFSGGMGLDGFRSEMLSDRHLKAIIDYTNAKDVFPNTSISGGVNYFVWKRDYEGDCSFTNITNGEVSTRVRDLSEFPVLVRYNQAVDIIHKVKKVSLVNLSTITSGLMPFGLSTNYRGRAKVSEYDSLTLYASNCVTYISRTEINKGMEYIDKFQVMISKTGAEHAGEPSKDGKFRVIPSSMKVIGPNEVCTHSYFLVGNFDNKDVADNLYKYMKTKLVRFLMLMSMSGYGLSKLVMNFVPLQEFDSAIDIDWSKSIHDIDVQLYRKYKLTDEEINFIESNVKEMS